MKDFIFGLAGIFILPIILVGAVIYAISYVMQLLFRTIIIGLDKCMIWIDKNITKKIR